MIDVWLSTYLHFVFYQLGNSHNQVYIQSPECHNKQVSSCDHRIIPRNFIFWIMIDNVDKCSSYLQYFVYLWLRTANSPFWSGPKESRILPEVSTLLKNSSDQNWYCFLYDTNGNIIASISHNVVDHSTVSANYEFESPCGYYFNNTLK